MNLKLILMIKTIVVFIIILLVISMAFIFSIYFIQVLILKIPSSVEYNFWQFSLYILGYGDSPNVDTAFQLLLGVVGIVFVSLLSTYLTVNLFKRAKDVFISDKILVWKYNKKEYMARFTVWNRGKKIYRTSIAMQIFDETDDETGEVINVNNGERKKPLIIKNKSWKIDYKISIGEFIYEFFQNHYKYNRNVSLYAVLYFIDSDTQQESIICKKYDAKDIIVIKNPVLNNNIKKSLFNFKKNRTTNFKKIKSDDMVLKQFIEYIKGETIPISLMEVIPINAFAISLARDSSKSFSAHVDFTNTDKENKQAEFVMALIKYKRSENWVVYYEKNYSFEFDIKSDIEITSVQLEIKDEKGYKIVDKEYPVTAESSHYSVKLRERDNPDIWVQINEICFTVFPHYTRNAKGIFYVSNCQLVENK
jgi:hypothetical protein